MTFFSFFLQVFRVNLELIYFTFVRWESSDLSTATFTYRKRPEASLALLRRGNIMCAQRARWNGSQICWIFGAIHQGRRERSKRTSQVLLLSAMRVANSARLHFCARGKIRQASPAFGKLRCAVLFKLLLKPVPSKNKSAFSAVLFF